MNKTALEILEFQKIIEELKSYTVSEMGKSLIQKIEPSFNVEEIRRWHREVTESKKIISSGSSVPLHSLKGLQNIFDKFGKGIVLLPEEFSDIAFFIKECIRLKKYVKAREGTAPMAASYGESIFELNNLYDEINKCIRGSQVDDRASNNLLKIRKKIIICDERIKTKIEKILRSSSYNKALQDKIVSSRYGRYVVPIKSEYRASIKGAIIDKSSSGATLFIEPEEIKKLQDEMNALRIDEDNEIYQILSYLMSILEEYQRELKINMEAMAYYDFLFAKAKYSRAIDGIETSLNCDKRINIINGRHPLLGKNAVPLNFNIGDSFRALVITGPNTGGKTVTLKTVGLLTLMVQCGLHVPVEEGSEFSAFEDILVDIGDGQSIENSLSTFSSHIRNLISIIKCADKNSLVIVDEVGTGTDPGEGMGLATAILEKVYGSGAILLATTHYSEIKDFANSKEGFQNGSMEFDIETLKPKYKLRIGESGESNAFLIALRLGMDSELIERAHEITYKEKKNYENRIKDNSIEQCVNKSVISESIEVAKKKREYKSIENKKKKFKKKSTFKVGDCVYVNSLGGTAIIVEEENRNGEVTILYKKKKLKINKKKVSIYIKSEELYPEGYDMNIVTESKDNRKKDKLFSKKHVEGMEIIRD